MNNWTGYLRLAVAPKGQQTVITDAFFQGAFKITRPVYLDQTGQACLYLMNPGGGYIDGDTYKMEVHLAQDAELLLTTQSSTKIYKTIHKPVIQETEIYLERGSYLEFINDPLIAYQDAQYQQQTMIHMERGAALLFTEIITPGWAPDGSLFRYNTVQLQSRIYMDKQLVVLDNLRLSPTLYSMPGIGMLDGYTHVGTMTVIGERSTRELIDELYQRLAKLELTVSLGMSMLSVPGFTLRILALDSQDIEHMFEQAQTFIRRKWFQKGAINLRKY